MVCQELAELEGDFLQARAESQYLDSLGWTDREFSCLHAILDHKREGHQGEPCAGDEQHPRKSSDAAEAQIGTLPTEAELAQSCVTGGHRA
jgi:hypothetical protein